LENKDYELMLELTYIIQATPWLQIQPDAQWIVQPGGSSDIPNALVLGVQLGVDI
jgi:porin